MTPRLGIVMDPIGAISVKKDSSFAMLLAAQARGWEVSYMELGDLYLRDGSAHAHMRALTVRDDPADWYTLGPGRDRALSELDVILMRKDPPFDMEYIYATYLLERAEESVDRDHRLAGRLRRGQLPIEGTLDLHGMTQAEARRDLTEFVADGRRKGARCLLVVTGKGSRSGTDDWGRPSPGVLREAVPRWLNLSPLRDSVLAFAAARPQHGGDGAFYLLLKRQR